MNFIKKEVREDYINNESPQTELVKECGDCPQIEIDAPQETEKIEKGFVPEYYRVVLPKKLDLGKIIKKHPLPADLDNKNRPNALMEDVRFMLGQIVEVFTNNKDLNPVFTDGYANLCSGQMQTKVRDYDKILKWAVDAGILETNNHFIPGAKCRGYRFTKKYEGFSIRHFDLYGKKFVKLNKAGVCKKTISKHPHLWKYHQGLEIDFDAVPDVIKGLKNKTYKDVRQDMNHPRNKSKYKKWLKKELKNEASRIIIYKQNCWINAASKLDDRAWLFKRDTNIGRLHTNVSGLKRELRPLLTYKGQQLIACDIKNSQPALSVALLDPNCWKKLDITKRILNYNKTLRHNKFHKTITKHTPIILGDLLSGKTSQDIRAYREAALEGRMYELMMNRYEKVKGKPISRDLIKKKFLSILFTPTYYNEQDKVYCALREEFPTVFEIFEWINTGYEKFKNGVGNGKNKRGKDEQSSALALVLQQLEADLILNYTVPMIIKNEPDMPIFTIHDSIVTTAGNEYKLKKYMIKAAYEYLGFTPKFEIEFDKWYV